MPHRAAAFVVASGLAVTAWAAGCASSGTAPRRSTVRMEEMRVTAQRDAAGKLSLQAYDAESLFEAAVATAKRGACLEGIAYYDRILREFPTSRFVSAAMYNSAVCLQQLGRKDEAAARYHALITKLPGSADVRHALLQLAGLALELRRFDEVVDAASRTLVRPDLTPAERFEALTRKAEGLLGLSKLDEAEGQARQALSFARSSLASQAWVPDERVGGAASFVLAETLRLRADAVTIPEGDVQTQRGALEARAEILLRAQAAYFDTIRWTDPMWAAASGYRIGSMYDSFWTAIQGTPVPAPPRMLSAKERAIYDEEYRRELLDLIEPLMRHAIRYWELTLKMVEQSGVSTEWTSRIRADLERARGRLLEAQKPANKALDSAQASP